MKKLVLYSDQVIPATDAVDRHLLELIGRSHPDLHLSSRFGEMLEDEKRSLYFRLFGDYVEAQTWLCAGPTLRQRGEGPG